MSAEGLSAALFEAQPVVVANEALAGGEHAAWIVGGAVRDAIAGREIVDLDLAVAADAPGAARRIAAACGGVAFELSEEFGTWRALAPDRSWHADVSGLRGETIELDLGRRDFTVNAIAIALGDRAVLDPYAGITDLEAGVLRAVSAESLSDDPLRVLRAARLAAELGLELEAGDGRARSCLGGARAGDRG